MKARTKTLTADEMLARMGDDPETLILAIRLLEHMNEKRLARKRQRRSKRRAA